jgi:hypothetical protein
MSRLFFVCLCLFFETGLRPGCYVAQAGPHLEVLLPQPLEYGVCSDYSAFILLVNECLSMNAQRAELK